MALVRTIGKLFASNAAKAVVLFVGTAYFAGELGGKAFAPFILFEALLGLLAIPADFGLRGATEKRISEGEHPPGILTTAALLKLPPLAVVVVLVLLLRGPVNGYLGADLAALLAVGLVLQEAALFGIRVLQGELRVDETASIQVVRYSVWAGLGAVLLEVGYGVRGLVYALLIGTFLASLWAAVRISVTPGRPSRSHAASLFDYSRYNVVSHIGGYFYQWMDVALLGLFVAPSLVTSYELAWRVTMLVVMFAGAISTSIFPRISALDASDSRAEIERLLPTMLSLSLLVSVPAFFGSLLYAEPILTFVFAPEYAVASLVLVLLMSEKILYSIHSVVGHALQAIDRPGFAARATLVAIGLNLLLNLLLIPRYGIVGAAVATLVSFGVNTLLHARYLARFLTLQFPTVEFGLTGGAAVLMTAVLLGLRSVYPAASLLDLSVSVVVGVLVYAATVLIAPQLRRQLRTALSF